MKSRSFKTMLIALIIATVIFQSCKKSEISPEIRSLEEAKSRWEAINLSDYSYKLKKDCFCVDVERVEITVVNKIITSIKNEQGQNIEFAIRNLTTIDQLFEYIKSSLEKNPHQATISYDQTYGYPTSIYIDLEQYIADDELGYEISDFVKK